MEAVTRLIASNDEIERNPSDYATSSKEGVSIDELAKLRMWHLQSQSNIIMRQTLMADAKAATVLALIGLVATRILLSGDLAAGGALTMLMFANKAAVLCLCLYVIMPRFPRDADWAKMRSHERFSWAALANPELQTYDFGEFAARSDASQMFRSIGRANHGMARVLLTKFKLLRTVFLLAIVDVVLTMAFFMGTGLG